MTSKFNLLVICGMYLLQKRVLDCSIVGFYSTFKHLAGRCLKSTLNFFVLHFLTSLCLSHSSLFEFGVLGLVLGYSMENPNCFVNGKLSLVTLLMVLKSFFISFYASSLMGMMDKNQCIQVIVLKDTSRSALKCETDTFSVFQDE
nr:uncharacterized protein LOC112272927 [Physcomitrium patens]|eukprot:XP_024356882.1 uncharacterized protein LOC112272927 [Physcomitrella patens]